MTKNSKGGEGGFGGVGVSELEEGRGWIRGVLQSRTKDLKEEEPPLPHHHFLASTGCPREH